MPSEINLKTFTDSRGNLTVLENVIPFEIKRIFYIYGVDNSERGGHRHKKTIQAAICIKGQCKIECNNGIQKQTYLLDHPGKCLLLLPEDYHKMFEFSKDAILMVIASTTFDQNDYIFEDYL